MSFARASTRLPAILGDGYGNIRPASWDLAAVRIGDAIDPGPVILAVLSQDDVSDAQMPAEGTPVVLVYNGSESPTLPYVDVDLLALI